jgi:aspartyl-tRNA(Asn)/glutamyl-tRNA(Gln) amidotransferase subunit A
MSLDQVGPIGNNVEDVALLLDVIKGKDERDTMTFESKDIKLSEIKKAKIGVLRIKNVDKRIQKLIDDKVELIKKKLKWATKEVEIKYIDLAVETYYPLVYAEFFSGTRKFDGRRYGWKIEDKCGKEVLRRILGGSEITKAEHKGRYYQKALAVKELIKEEFEKVFKDYDCVILPTVPGIPWKIGEGDKMSVEEDYAYDALTIPANLAEICAISIPAGIVKEGKENIPIGMQIFCGKGEESKMLSIAKEVEGL